MYLLGGRQTRIATPDFAAGVELVAAIGAATAAEPDHPDVDLRSTRVDVRLTCYDTKGVTDREIRLARTISGVAAEAGLAPLAPASRGLSEEPRQRWRPDVWVDPAEVQPRIDAAVAAGATS